MIFHSVRKTVLGTLVFITSWNNLYGQPFEVISNKNGNTDGYKKEMIHWFEENLPTLPENYLEKDNFIYFEPLFHYIDSVNWSLFSLSQFREIGKLRGIRLPEGTKIIRNRQTGAWQWPSGAETIKLLQTKIKNKEGEEDWFDLELRLARKIENDWAMATYVRDEARRWRIVKSPDLRLNVPQAITPLGHTRNVLYTLTPPEACMTCHSRGSQSSVDLRRGSEFVYGANDELLTGRTKIRLSQWNSSDELKRLAKEIVRSEAEDWVEIQANDLEKIKKYREAFSQALDHLPPLH